MSFRKKLGAQKNMPRIYQEDTFTNAVSLESGMSDSSSKNVITLTTAINCGEIVVKDSNNVTIGNSMCFNGPVTIVRHCTPNVDASSTNSLLDALKDLDINEYRNTSMEFRKRLKTRLDWRAKVPRSSPKPLITTPAPYVVIGHTVCHNFTSEEDCEQQVRNIQHCHFSLGFPDIGYNFLVGGDGNIYVGRGWDYIGQHTKYFNSESIGIAFIGTFIDELLPVRQMEAAKLLIDTCVQSGKLSSDYKLFLQCQLRASESPGAKLAEEIRSWPHWTEYKEVLYPRCG